MNSLLMATSRRRQVAGSSRRNKERNTTNIGRTRPSSAFSGITARNSNRNIPMALASNSNYMKETGVIEFLKKNYEKSNLPKAPKKSDFAQKSVDDYREEMISLKRKLQDLSTENSVLKMKVWASYA